MKSFQQVLVIADPIIPRIGRKEVDWDLSILETIIQNTNILYTSLLPGPELEAAKIAYSNNIPYIVTVPYKKICSRWPKKIEQSYNFYLKRSLKTIYIDREIEYISDYTEPGNFHKQKSLNQIQYILNKISLFEGNSALFGCFSKKTSRKLVYLNEFFKNSQDTHQWRFFQNTYFEKYTIEDDLPF
jgi:hypothetical protein